LKEAPVCGFLHLPHTGTTKGISRHMRLIMSTGAQIPLFSIYS